MSGKDKKKKEILKAESPESMKLKIWEEQLSTGIWRPDMTNCLYRQEEILDEATGKKKLQRHRLNFRDPKILRVEKRRPLTQEEKKVNPNLAVLWEVVKEIPYSEVTAGMEL